MPILLVCLEILHCIRHNVLSELWLNISSAFLIYFPSCSPLQSQPFRTAAFHNTQSRTQKATTACFVFVQRQWIFFLLSAVLWTGILWATASSLTTLPHFLGILGNWVATSLMWLVICTSCLFHCTQIHYYYLHVCFLACFCSVSHLFFYSLNLKLSRNQTLNACFYSSLSLFFIYSPKYFFFKSILQLPHFSAAVKGMLLCCFLIKIETESWK